MVKRLGIVVRHAGDGVTAFFLAEDVGSASGAARAAIEAGRAIGAAAATAAGELEQDNGSSAREEVRMNVGVHWGGALYLGQVVTGGRLEVTALGDEVNETARIQRRPATALYWPRRACSSGSSPTTRPRSESSPTGSATAPSRRSRARPTRPAAMPAASR